MPSSNIKENAHNQNHENEKLNSNDCHISLKRENVITILGSSRS